MKVFISWSGELSKELGSAFRDWLPSVIQSVKPYFTPNDIEKGARWGQDIAQELDDSSFGIFCITRENLSKPWIMFEAGALSKRISSSNVCPILFDVQASDLQGPLVQFQASVFEKSEIKKLLKSINHCLGDQKLADSVFETVFEMWWPRLEIKVAEIISSHRNTIPIEASRSDRDLLEEILQLNRLSSKRSTNLASFNPLALEEILDFFELIIDGSGLELPHLSSTAIDKPFLHLIGRLNINDSKRQAYVDRVKNLSQKITSTTSSD